MLKFIDRKQSVPEDHTDHSKPAQDVKNVVIFGESGVGKSSLINLIAGERVSEISSGALGCTLKYKRHLLDLGDQHFAVWDTAGLDEGSQGSVPAEKAEAYLKLLLHELAKNNGIDLLIYCVRGTRVRSALLTNYHIFYSAICRKRVPIAIVVTGLENQEGSMETWWLKNELVFSSLKMYFDGHACVTTLESFTEHAILKQRREMSRATVTNMITSMCRTQRWRPPERNWVESAYSDIRAMLTPRDHHRARLATIIMCEAFRDYQADLLTRKHTVSFQNPVSLPLSFCPFSFRSPISFSNDGLQSKLPFQDGIKHTPEHVYHVYQVPRHQASSKDADEETKKVMIVKRGADLLIFCVKTEETESAVRLQWEHFNTTYGGDLSPRIVVVAGAPDQSSAEKWWKRTVGGAVAKNDVDVAHVPSAVDAEAEAEVARRQLQYLINDRCIDHGKMLLTRDEKLFRQPPSMDISNLMSLWVKPESYGKGDGPPSPKQDILTELGVWDEVLEQSPSAACSYPPKESRGR